jgi:hypothetical protein
MVRPRNPASQLSLCDLPMNDVPKAKPAREMTGVQREALVRKMIARGCYREEIQEAIQCSTGSLRVILWRIRKDDVPSYVAPPERPSGKRAAMAPQTESEKQKRVRDDNRLAKIDKALNKARVCKVHHLRMFGGKCFDCESRGGNSTGMGQAMAAFAWE